MWLGRVEMQMSNILINDQELMSATNATLLAPDLTYVIHLHRSNITRQQRDSNCQTAEFTEMLSVVETHEQLNPATNN